MFQVVLVVALHLGDTGSPDKLPSRDLVPVISPAMLELPEYRGCQEVL